MDRVFHFILGSIVLSVVFSVIGLWGMVFICLLYYVGRGLTNLTNIQNEKKEEVLRRVRSTRRTVRLVK